MDWEKLFFGEAPPLFLIEVVFRNIIIYVLLLVSLRLLGNRMVGQINRIEQAVLVTMSATVGLVLQSPERGILATLIISIIIVSVARLIAFLSIKNKKFETTVLGSIDKLIQDSTLNMHALKKTTITRDQVFAELRSHQIQQLGEVKDMFIEASGSFTIIKEANEKPGLSILPEKDIEFIDLLETTNEWCCAECGCLMKNEKKCECENSQKIKAVKSISL